jgi:hypothetical protein
MWQVVFYIGLVGKRSPIRYLGGVHESNLRDLFLEALDV